jgi:hypothetical protein
MSTTYRPPAPSAAQIAASKAARPVDVYALRDRLNTYKNGTVFHHPDCKR